MTVVGSREIGDARRHHLAALAYEIEGRGLSWRLAGPGESVLHVANPVSRRQVMVVAMPVNDGWYYLWAGGGMGDVTQPAHAADQIARLLG
ncbi:hypothetical protein [Thermomonospora umbrina]|uniref:Uncharacterized protein n=1 Tax=Thermomonospora umbrina TaxID=111806 RepID=A0A3D9SMV1_9ACTN|nr:hypothetical protein [Thermomonospora umbrina]REE95740.1 hypothetical protein DFJ69_1149 [Thermomonospora umbrina]